jgi:hypothetical protein
MTIHPRPFIRLLLATAAVGAAFVAAALPAFAAQRIATGVGSGSLAVDAHGTALITYRSGGRIYHVFARRALNALLPNRQGPQVKLQLDYTGGARFYGRAAWSSFRNGCRTYDGPKLFGVVASCRASDGSYWALQRWQEALPDLGFHPWLPEQTEPWLEVSHWFGPLPVLAVSQSWNWGSHYNQLFGSYSWGGSPIYGFGTTPTGVPTDSYGRLVYLDTLDSTYGSGWYRENSFVSRNPTGKFCYGFVPHDPTKFGYAFPPTWKPGEFRPAANGTRYRVYSSGPGVLPIVEWEGPALHRFDGENPVDTVAIIRNARNAAATGQDACSGGAFARLAGLQKWNSLVFPSTTSIAGFHESFSTLSPNRWRGAIAAGGAAATPGTSGLQIDLPAGGASSLRLATRRSYLTQGGGAFFVDLGAAGVAAPTKLLLALNAPHSNTSYVGFRIAEGKLSWVTGRAVFGSGSPLTSAETPSATVPYNSSSMRWLLCRQAANPIKAGRRFETFYAPDPAGPWTSLAVTKIPAFFNNGASTSPVRITIMADSDGTTASSLTLKAINE